MLNITQDQALRRYESLPESLKSALISDYYNDIIDSIAKTNNLNEDQTEKLFLIYGDVILGFIHPDDLSKNLVDDLKIKEDVVKDIVKEIEERIFKYIRKDLVKNYNPEIKEVEPVLTEELSLEVKPTSKPEIQAEHISFEIKNNQNNAQLTSEPIKLENVAKSQEPEPLANLTEKAPQITNEIAAKPTNSPQVVTAQPEAAAIAIPITSTSSETVPLEKSFNLGELKIQVEQESKPREVVAANIQTSKKEPKQETPRVVHYSQFRTPLPENFQPISEKPQASTDNPQSTEKINPPSPLKTETAPAAPIPPNPLTQSQPKTQPISGPEVEGNIIDLRNL